MKQKSHITGVQCRAARALLDWTAAKLARDTLIDLGELRLFERERHSLTEPELRLLRGIFQFHGITLVSDPKMGSGVMLREKSSASPEPAPS